MPNALPRFAAPLALYIFLALMPAHAQQPVPPPPNPVPSAGYPAPLTVTPPPATPPPYVPFPQWGTLPLDEQNNGIGFAQSVSRARGLQARLLWIDATANLDRINSAQKIHDLVALIKDTGFTTICFEAKPISGQVLYPSKFAPKLTEFGKPGVPTKYLPGEFDPVGAMATECKTAGINLILSLNAFSEGHQLLGTGPGFAHPEWQTVLYEESPKLRSSGAPLGYDAPLAVRTNELPVMEGEISVYTDAARVAGDVAKRRPDLAVVVVADRTGRVIAQTAGASWNALSVAIPDGGAAFVGQNIATATFLRQYCPLGTALSVISAPIYVPIGERPRRQTPLMTNPFRAEVRARLLSIVTEAATNYDIGGVIFDDRLRYAGLDADFSPEARQAFETYMGKSVRWPDDVLRFGYRFPQMERTLMPGQYYDAWLTFRALALRNRLADIVRAVKAIKPQVTVSTYVGSWYPDYPDVGANWAADDFSAGYRFLNPSYQKTGWAGLTDFVVTGCYYTTGTIADALARGEDIGSTVEAAGQFSNRAVNDASWVYAGIELSDFKGKTPDDLRRCLQAAAATTQGVMVFDLSHDFETWRPVFKEAFTKPAGIPHLNPDALAEVRRLRAAKKAAGTPDPPVILYRGKGGTGF